MAPAADTFVLAAVIRTLAAGVTALLPIFFMSSAGVTPATGRFSAFRL